MIIPANYAQANFRFTGSALPSGAEVTLGFNIELYSGTPAEMASDLGIGMIAVDLLDWMSNTVTLSEIEVKFGPNATGPSGTASPDVDGQAGSTPVAPNTALLVKKNTGFGGRTGRGRFYWPGVPEDMVDQAGVLNGVFLTNVQGLFNAWTTRLETDGMIPTLLHGPDSPVSAPLPITSLTVDARAATQRRRLRR